MHKPSAEHGDSPVRNLVGFSRQELEWQGSKLQQASEAGEKCTIWCNCLILFLCWNSLGGVRMLFPQPGLPHPAWTDQTPLSKQSQKAYVKGEEAIAAAEECSQRKRKEGLRCQEQTVPSQLQS